MLCFFAAILASRIGLTNVGRGLRVQLHLRGDSAKTYSLFHAYKKRVLTRRLVGAQNAENVEAFCEVTT